MPHPSSYAMRLLAGGMWLAMALLLNDEFPAFCVEGAKRHRRSRHRDRPPRTSRFGNSAYHGIIIANENNGDEPSSSYFERNAILPPPLVSRSARRVQAEAPSDPTRRGAAYGDYPNAHLRRDLLWGRNDYDESRYDKHSYPWEYAWHNQTGTALEGVPVELNINFHRVFSMDVVNSVMDLIVWFRLVWVDPRLTWKPEEYGNLDKVWFWIGDGGAGGESSEIWTPDVELWNLETGLQGSLEDSYARVSHDGTVWWGRPGHLRPTCKFDGLDSFPFDRLECGMEFGSWASSGKYVRMEKFDGVGFTVGDSLTVGASYNEYSFAAKDPVECVKHIYTFESTPEEDWPVLLYNVTISRSWQPYTRGYILTQVILNVVGFSAFWLPPSCGERMTLSVTAMLAALTSDIIVAAKLPAAAELTWFSKFSMLSTMFAFVSLIESVVVLNLYYKRSEDVVPRWYTFMKDWYLVRQAKTGGVHVKERGSIVVARTADFVAETTGLFSAGRDAARRASSADATDGASPREGGMCDEAESGDGSAHVRRREISRPSARKKISRRPRRGTCDLHNSLLSKASAIPRDVDDFLDEEELQNNMKWKHVASKIDDAARFWIPLLFIVSLSIIFAEVS